jgi:hypothetical protein
MKRGRIFLVILIGFVFVYLIYSMAGFGEGNADRQVESVQRIISRALIQCYALEGSYPAYVEHLENYGVIFDHDRYVYYYEWFASNLMPTVVVIAR